MRQWAEVPMFRTDEDPASDGPMSVYMDANEDDEEVRDVLSNLRVGESHTFGGGAAAESTVRRIR